MKKGVLYLVLLACLSGCVHWHHEGAWKFRSTSDRHYESRPDGLFYAYSGKDALWSYQLPSPLAAEPLETEEALYLQTLDGTVLALELNGHPLWEYHQKTTGLLARKGSQPVYFDGQLYVLQADGRLLALEAAKGRLLWEAKPIHKGSAFELQSSEAPLIVNEALIAVGRNHGVVEAYDRQTGAFLWKKNSCSPIKSLILDAKHQVKVVC